MRRSPDWIRFSVGFLPILFFFFAATQANAATLTQSGYRWYVNENAQTPGDPWPVGGTNLAENTAITGSDAPPQTGTVIRLRININVADVALSTGSSFKLQYGVGAVCSTVSSWNDVDAISGSGAWRGYDNSSVTTGGTLTNLVLSSSNVRESYEEQNASAGTPNAAQIGEYGEWDWVIQNNGAVAGSNYCFRMVTAAGAALDAYNDYPSLVTRPFIPKSQNWRWYGDENHETPTSTLAGENARALGIRTDDAIKLRMTIAETNATDGANQKYRLQFSTSSNFAYAPFVEEQANCASGSEWCYADGVDTDDDAITTRVLTDSGVSGRHNETGTSASTFTHPASASVETEFTLKRHGADPETVYYFRAYDQTNGAVVAAQTGTPYPSAKTFNTVLSFSVSGIDTGVSVDGWMTNVATTATVIPFGTLVPNHTVTAAQSFTIAADGNGYSVYLKTAGPFQDTNADEIGGIVATNELPAPWNVDAGDLTSFGTIGYHTDDGFLAGGSTRFASSDTWAPPTTDFGEVAYNSFPTEGDTTRVVFRIFTSALAPSGSYQAQWFYVAVPTY